MWQEISTDKDLQHFMNQMYNFHDSCIKELKYTSGAYVNNDLSMHPVNDCRVLRVIIQRQYKDDSMIELEFDGLKFLKLVPIDDAYTCEILDSYMFFRDGYVYWCDNNHLSETDLYNFEGTMICASRFRWRSVENYMGSKDFYFSTLDNKN